MLVVYATTAANPSESSYACYYDDQRSTYLGDWYSVNWMEDSDMVSLLGDLPATCSLTVRLWSLHALTLSLLQEDLSRETLHKQYQLVKSHTNTSHVMQYGNKVSGLPCAPCSMSSKQTHLERQLLVKQNRSR